MSNKRMLILVIATFLTVITWVVFDILHSRSQVQPSAEVQQLLEPVSPHLDTEAVNDL